VFRRAAGYVDRISRAKASRPSGAGGDQVPATINLKTAKALGLARVHHASRRRGGRVAACASHAVAAQEFADSVYERDFAARITSPGTGAPASVRNSAWTIFDRRPERVSSRST
jgi:hypothetical protein